MSSASRLLLLWGLLWGWSAVLAGTPSCTSLEPSACCAASSSDWMLNGQGMNPCQLIEQVMRTCAPAFSVQLLPEDVRCPVTRDPYSNVPSSCCCSTVSFALFAACRLCQANATTRTSFYEFLNGCGQNTALGVLPPRVEAVGNISIPPWAGITPHAYGDLWDARQAFENATSSSSDGPRSRISGRHGASNVVALTCALLGVALLGVAVGLLYFVRIRRRRVRRAAPGAALSKFQSKQPLIDLTQHIDQPKMDDPGAPIVPWGTAHRLPAHPQPARRHPRRPVLHVANPNILRRVSGMSSGSSAAAPTGALLAPSAQFLLSIGQPPLLSTPAMARRW